MAAETTADVAARISFIHWLAVERGVTPAEIRLRIGLPPVDPELEIWISSAVKSDAPWRGYA